MSSRAWMRSFVLLTVVVAIGGSIAAWKVSSMRQAAASSANQPELMETVTVAVAKELEHREATTSIGTVLALRSITLRNELAGTVSQVMLTPGQVVDAGTLLVALDVSVEEAELRAQEAQALLAETTLTRMRQLTNNGAASQEELDRARSERDVALAQIARTKAIIAKKTIRAPFRARVGLADVHLGQYLNEGTNLTTLQGVDEAVHVDFTVAQWVAEGLRVDESVEVFATSNSSPTDARIVAIDARIDPTTRNAMVRARIEGNNNAVVPGASVRVLVPVGAQRKAVSVPVSALRKGPDGDHVFVLESDKDGNTRAHARRVESGTVIGDEVLILTGLSPGARVAASGSFKLREAALVTIVSDPRTDSRTEGWSGEQ